jgi:hypothetical protein
MARPVLVGHADVFSIGAAAKAVDHIPALYSRLRQFELGHAFEPRPVFWRFDNRVILARSECHAGGRKSYTGLSNAEPPQYIGILAAVARHDG